MLEYIFIKILFISIAASAGFAVIYTVSKLAGRFFTKRIVRILWLIPLLSALIPVTALRISGAADKIGIADTLPVYVSQKIEERSDFQKNTDAAEVNKSSADETTARDETENLINTAVKRETEIPDINFIKLCSILYFIGLIIMIIFRVVSSVRFRRGLKNVIEKGNDGLTGNIKNELGIKKNVGLYFINSDISPFVYGIINPKIIMPAEGCTREAITHELIHIRNKDLLYLMLLGIVKIVHFFNPFVYICSKEIKNSIELACDEFCAELMTEEERFSYSKQIVEFSVPAASGAAYLSENGRKIKERVEFIMTYKKKSRAAKITALCISVILLLCQTAIAAAVNSGIPKSYIINNANEIYSVIYQTENDYYYSNRTGRLENRASLINTEFYKGFSADLHLEFKDTRDYDFIILDNDENTEKFDADMKIEMDKFIKSVNNGKVWQGIFTVTINDEIVFEKARGYLNNIPGDYDRDAARLFIEDGGRRIDIEYINFGLKSDSIINAENEISVKENFDAEVKRYLSGRIINCVNNIADGNTYRRDDKDDAAAMNIFYNTKTGDMYIDQIQLYGSRYITSVPGEKYAFENDSVTGKFFLKESGGIILDEFEGTLSGITGNDLKFESKDKAISVSMNMRDNESFNQNYEKPNYTDGDFIAASEQKYYTRRLSELPFTLELNKDKNKVIMTVKDGFNPAGWGFSYASYIGENDVYQKGNSDEGKRIIELELSPSFGTHNLQFSYFNTEPYAQKNSIDILFKIVNGEILYNNSQEGVLINKNYSGEKAMEELSEFFSIYY